MHMPSTRSRSSNLPATVPVPETEPRALSIGGVVVMFADGEHLRMAGVR